MSRPAVSRGSSARQRIQRKDASASADGKKKRQTDVQASFISYCSLSHTFSFLKPWPDLFNITPWSYFSHHDVGSPNKVVKRWQYLAQHECWPTLDETLATFCRGLISIPPSSIYFSPLTFEGMLGQDWKRAHTVISRIKDPVIFITGWNGSSVVCNREKEVLKLVLKLFFWHSLQKMQYISRTFLPENS